MAQPLDVKWGVILYREFKNIKNVMKFLKEHTYGHINKDIWDCNLWFYGKVENLNNKMFYTDNIKNIKLYKFEDEYEILQGVAVVSYNKFCTNVYLDVLKNIDINEFIYSLIKENGTKPIWINCCRDYIANTIIKNVNGKLSETLSMYYCFKEDFKEDKFYEVKELTISDKDYFDYNWHHIKASMEQGIRFFTIIENNKIISLAGLAPFSTTRAEIVCVKTHEQYRNKGFSKALCNYVINEGFKEYSVLTWTTHCNNNKSISLSNSLNFKHLINTYQIIINKNKSI